MFKNLIIAAVVSVVVWFAKDYFEDAPALTYLTSDPIEAGSAQGRPEYVQEISVLNRGRVGAKAVSIKVPHSISSYQLHKHSNLAKEASQNGANSFELLYPELPPEQRIVLFIRYEGNPVAREWVAVGHAEGNAQPLEKQSGRGSRLSLLAVFWGGFLSCFLLDLRRQRRHDFVREAPAAQLLRDDRPWFAGPQWSKTQAEALIQALPRLRAPSPEGGLAYRLLNQGKPALMSDADWAEVRDRAGEALGDELSRAATASPDKATLVGLAGLAKPEHLPEDAWKSLQDAIRKQLFELFLPARQTDTDDLNLPPPAGAALRDIPEPLLSELRTAMQEHYLRQLIERAADPGNDPAGVLQTARLEALSDDQAARLRRQVEQQARLRKMPRTWDIAGLRAFLIEGRPAWMAETEYAAIRRLVEMYDDLEDGLDYLKQREQQAKAEQAEADRVRRLALAQLGLIDRVLTNPDAVDTLEDYDAAIPESYRKSLERVARLLRAHRPTAEIASLGKIGGERRRREQGLAEK